jgi:hypothetical protein
MKEANLLIFRDFSIKLGDFGISIKMKELPLQEGDTDEYDIKGLTPGYTPDILETYFREDNKMERKDLIKNDCFALYTTFNHVY